TVSNVGTQVVHFLQRRQAEEALRQSEARKAAVLEAALDAIVTFDQEGKVLECNPAAEAMFACQRASLLGRDMVELFPPGEARERFRQTLSAGERGSGADNHPAAAQGGMAETTALRVDGTEFPVELAVSRIRSDGPPVFTCYVRDLSERRRTEEAL